MSLTGDLYLEHKENRGNSIINRQMRTALSEQRHQGRVHFEKVLVSCKRNSRTRRPNSRAGGTAAYPPGVGKVTAAVTDTRDKLACMAAGTFP